MSISLMSYVPYDAVVGGVIDIVESHCDLHHAKTGGQMSWVDRKLIEDITSKLFTNLRQLFHFQLSQVIGIFYLAKKACVIFFHF